MNEKEISIIVDALLVKLPTKKKFSFLLELAKYFIIADPTININTDKRQIPLNVRSFMYEQGYLTNDVQDAYDTLEPKGIDAKNAGGHFKYLDKYKRITELKQIEFEKSKIDLEPDKKTLIEFSIVKWFVRIGFVISIILALKELYKLLKQ